MHVYVLYIHDISIETNACAGGMTVILSYILGFYCDFFALSVQYIECWESTCNMRNFCMHKLIIVMR